MLICEQEVIQFSDMSIPSSLPQYFEQNTPAVKDHTTSKHMF